MSLYQKYRPKVFADVVGQEDAITLLANLCKKVQDEQTIPHAYVFCGSHGIGKTTLARIFARELGTAPDDVYELDAASTSRKIDDMRELIESMYTLPILSKYKVYILDEAHALTKDSSNAFLKALEEPPAHVLFILCTTDPEKIIPTVRSRCTIVNFKSASIENIIKQLSFITEKENVSIDQESLLLIAKHSNSSYRDSITHLEKTINTFGEVIKITDTEKIFGSNGVELYTQLLDIVSTKNTDNLYTYIENSAQQLHFENLIEYIRLGILYRHKVLQKEINPELFLFVDTHTDVFTSKTLLYMLEKLPLYEKVSDKKSFYIGVFGEFISL
jgi:DNA polymerase-3 subunit gamma/tau